jgi:RND family efflux transporter MFP subunit
LASLRTASLEIQIEEARANLLEKQQVLAELEAGLRPEEIAQAKARMQAAEAEFKYAEAHSKRVEDLASRADRTVTDRELDEARYDTERTRQAFAQAQADYDLKLSGYREEQIAAARAAADAQQKVIENLQDELERMTIKAPFTGYLVEKHTEVGEWLQMGGIVATLARLDEVEVQLNVEESMIHEIRIDQVVDVHVSAIAGRTLPGTVRQIIPRSEWSTGSRSFPVIVRMQNVIQNGRPLLSEGMVARVVFTGEPREALLADKDAVLRSTNKPLVYVAQLKSDGKLATVRPVEVSEGLNEGQYIEVNGELQEGDLVVVEGVEGLHPYDEVEIIDAPPTISTDRSRDPQSGLLSAD